MVPKPHGGRRRWWSGRLADGIGQDTGGQMTILMRMLCRVIGLKGATIRSLHSPLPPAHA